MLRSKNTQSKLPLRVRKDLISVSFGDPTMERGTNSRASDEPPHEVFLNFRGPDTRDEFTDFLYHSMVDVGIHVFRDAESLHVGNKIGDELLQAIGQSKIYIPIFSRNYASSRWCLRELAHMVDCTSRSNDNKEILPIFLNVEPLDVKLRTNLYREALSKHREKFSTEVESWEKALIEVGEIKGWNWKKGESQVHLLQSVIQTVLAKLNVRYKKNVTEDLVGVDDRVKAIIKLLDVKSNGVQFLGIYGMGGIGKTTLAKVIFNQLSSHFRCCNFLSDVRESAERHGLVYLQEKLLSKFLDSHCVHQIHDVDDGISMIKRVLRNKKVLIVLDDVDEKKQVESLAGKGNWFGSGSRIIITTRDQSVLMVEGEPTSEGPATKSANVSNYEVEEMKFDHALKLFSRYAFRRDSPPENYISLSEDMVSTLGKLPLALEVTGSSLSGKSKAFWEDTLKKLKKAPSMEIQKTLKITYERLDDAQRQIFLDIACFFVNKDKTYPFYMWDDCEYCPHNAIEVLSLMSLIKIKDDNTFWMHDQVRDLGRAIVRQENSKYPFKCSRVWNHEEALRILEQKEGSRKIEALSTGNRGNIVMHDEVANLQKLRFFETNGALLVGDFNNLLPSLAWLSWQFCPSEFVATNFRPTNLVILNLSCSSISEEWIGWNQIKAASKLKILDLSNCNNLRKTPDLSAWESLERLILEGCLNLNKIDPSIGKLKLLTTLNLNGCESLRELPEELGCLEALIEILMPCSPYMFELPETFGNLKSLLTFDVSHRQIWKLPCLIGGMVKLRQLNISKCRRITELPYSVEKLQSLVELDLSFTSLDHLPDSIGNLKQLKVLRMSHISSITELPIMIGMVEKLEELYANYCGNLTGKIPHEIGLLSHLRILDLSYTCIFGLPSTMSRLSNLQILNLESCPALKHLPWLPPSLTCVRWTTDAVKFSEGVQNVLGSVTAPSFPKTMNFIPWLPSSLRELQLGHVAIGQSFDLSKLKNLLTLRLDSCVMWGGLRAHRLKHKKRVHDLAPFQLKMESLRHLEMRRCLFGPEVLDLSSTKNLREVQLLGCKCLVEIHGLEELGSLCSLLIEDCNSMEKMSDLSKLRKLRKLRVGQCPKLRSVEGLYHLESLQKLWIHDCKSLESLADTSNLDLHCHTIERCERLPKPNSYCQCHDNRDLEFTEHDHARYF